MSNVDYKPNTRARVAARRAAQRGPRKPQATSPRKQQTSGSSMVRPGMRRAVGSWLVTGRLFSLIVLIATLVTLYIVFTSPQFHVQQVEVRGNSALTSDAVTDLTGLRGSAIWFVDTGAAVQRLLGSAYIEQARVDIALPNRAVVTLVERQPDVRWQIGGSQYLVDSAGKVLDVAKDAAAAGTLVVEDSSTRLLEANGQVDPDALTLARRLSLRLPTEVNITPTRIGWDIGLGIYVDTASGQRIVFGQTDRLDQKIAVLAYLTQDKTQFTYLDLRSANPFYQNGQPPKATDQQMPTQ